MENKFRSDHVESHSDSTSRDKLRRTRRTRSKLSSVNSRLDPDFDLREHLSCKDEESKHKNVELNPRTIEFEKLVDLLHPTFILEYLQKILHYLTSSMTKMSFQNIALYKEVLLVRLCQKKSNLNCGKFSEEARKVALQIMEVLKANQNVYEWIYKYEKGIFCPDVLVYEKVYYTSESLQITINSNVIGPPSRSIQNSNANGDSNTEVVQITHANKAHMLNTLLKFIKDNTQLKLEYPHIHKSQAPLLTSLISKGKVTDMEVGFGCKSLYAPLHEALNAYKTVYDFNVMFEEDSGVTFLMILEKIPRLTKIKLQNTKQSTHSDHKSTVSNASDSFQKADPNKSSKQMINLSFVGAVDESFVRASLSELVDFLADEARASLQFAKLTKPECGYLSRILQYSREARHHEQFPPACRALLRRVHAATNNNIWRLEMEIGKTDKATCLQNITMHKEPYYRGNTKLAAQVAPHSQTAQTPPSTPRGTKIPAKAKPISFQSAGAADTGEDAETDKSTEKPEKTVEDMTKLVAHNSRKSRLLAAMSVPLECDKGERMMRLMGWHGGALGLRGEGITEPIIPPLHIAPGAGLGHVKQVQTTQTKHEFHCQFLNSVLSFLRSEASETTLEYNDCLERKKIRFVNRAIQSMKQGIGCGLTHADEKKLLEEIYEEMRKQGKQVEGAVIGPDNKKISLQKAPLILRKTKGKKHKNKPDSSTKNAVATPNNADTTPNYSDPTLLYNQSTLVQNTDANGCTTETITEDQVAALRNHFDLYKEAKTPTAAETLAYKVISLIKIKEFLQKSDEKRCYTFECTQENKLKNQIKSYVSTVIMNVNRKVRQQFRSVLESVIYDDIRKAIPAGCCLSVVFDNLNFTLQKKVYQKRFTNSARDLPQPKSTDLKNTIIYQNNKIISCIDVTNDDDDDVILIEKKIDVIEISDGEDNEMDIDSETISNEVNLDSETVISTIQTENSEKADEKLTDVVIEDSLDNSFLSTELSQNLSTSRETLLLEMLEDDFKVKTDIVDTLDNDIKELEKVIIDCEFLCNGKLLKPMQMCVRKQELEEHEDYCIDGAESIEINNNNNSLISGNKINLPVSDSVQSKKENVDTIDCGIHEKHTTYKSLDIISHKITSTDMNTIEYNRIVNNANKESCLHLTKDENIKEMSKNEINSFTINKGIDNLHLIAEHNHSEIESVSDEEKGKEIEIKLQTNKEVSNKNGEALHVNEKHPTEIPDCVQKNKEETYLNAAEVDFFKDYKDTSPGYAKRSRSSSITSELDSVCKKCKSQIRSIRITCKEPSKVLNTDVIRKVQSVISESIDIIIDNVDFLPRLQCHGVKSGGLIYSCYDDKTFAWLTNFVLSDLDLNVTETDYPSKTYMEIKIYSFEDVDKIFNRLMLYNPELDTSLWRVVDKKEFEEFVIIKVEIDRKSFAIVNKNNYTFFAGIDKAKFNILWS